MSKFDEVTAKLDSLPYLKEERALVLRSLIDEIDASNVLELGFYQGKSAAYLAAILDDRGQGHVTTIDLNWSKTLSPNIHDTLTTVDLGHRVTPIFAKRSYTWELARMIKQSKQFDFCYLDGGHNWDMTGFGFVLVDLLLRPGGIVILDDLNWSMAKSIKNNPDIAKQYAHYDEDEIEEQSVKLVWNTIVPRLGYKRTRLEWPWGIAKKPSSE